MWPFNSKKHKAKQKAAALAEEFTRELGNALKVKNPNCSEEQILERHCELMHKNFIGKAFESSDFVIDKKARE